MVSIIDKNACEISFRIRANINVENSEIRPYSETLTIHAN